MTHLRTNLIFLVGGVGLFLSSWIIVPAPTMSLYPLAVGAPEVSPWLIGLNAIALVLAGLFLQGWLKWSLMIGAIVGLLLSSLPLLQLPSTQQQASTTLTTALGANYLTQIPASLQSGMRPQPFVLADVFRGIPLKEGRFTAGIPFRSTENSPLTLDLYRPPQVGHYPTLVMIHGGAWQSGSPRDHSEFNRYLAAQGYTVVAISYRLAPAYQFPVQLEDVQTALAFIWQHAAEYEIDVNRVALMGRSAGAHLAMLAGYQSELPIKAIVSYYGPVDLIGGYRDLPSPDPLDNRKVLRTFLGGSPDDRPLLYKQASPTYVVQAGEPATLLVYGSRDHIVKAVFGRQLNDRLKQLQNKAILIEIPWAEHAFDAVFNGLSNQLALYYTERFLADQLRAF